MCGASKRARKIIDAEVGDTYKVATNKYGQGAFVPIGETVEECVACVKGDTQMVTFAGIPVEVQKDYGVGPSAVGRFIEVDLFDYRLARDMVDFGNHHGQVDFAMLAGSHAHIGIANAGSGEYSKLVHLAGRTATKTLERVS